MYKDFVLNENNTSICIFPYDSVYKLDSCNIIINSSVIGDQISLFNITNNDRVLINNFKVTSVGIISCEIIEKINLYKFYNNINLLELCGSSTNKTSVISIEIIMSINNLKI